MCILFSKKSADNFEIEHKTFFAKFWVGVQSSLNKSKRKLSDNLHNSQI